ncbi:uncharacterized protein LOC129231640 [Uloborus diversus]|uniref:uncharacterized protein LOC129231640 n=1 Tax=Uloborus diversus TaxID=327109 RepID=UPI00240936B0|nr:uncharacterized protein LOC129231640 [Uloborus diversus]
MTSSTVPKDGDRSSGFKESLRFFQNQVEKDNALYASARKTLINGHSVSDDADSSFQNKINLRTNSAPSVDNILSNVKTLCANHNGNQLSDSTPKYPSVHRNINKDNKTQPKVTPIISKTCDDELSRLNGGVTRTEQVSVSGKVTVSDHSKRPSLLSSFNPTFEPAESEQDTQKDKTSVELGFGSVHSKTNYQSHATFGTSTTSSIKVETNSITDSFQHQLSFEKSNSSALKTNSELSTSKNWKECAQNEKMSVLNKLEPMNSSSNRTFGQCKDKLLPVDHKIPLVKNTSHVKSSPNEQTNKTLKETKHNDEELSEKHSDPFESDYDSQDFVVHKANFSEDFLEAMSEDNYSSVNEDYEVEHLEEQPRGPNIPSPDYASDEEECYIQQGDDAEYEDVEFIDNSAQYANDPRRYIYYSDDKELEVIPEEDEDDIDDDNEIYSHDEVYKPGGYHVSNQSSDDSRYNNHGECDSGLTDDQRSSSSTAEECDLEDDTDSAKGSLPLHDSSSESPTYNERANMFQNVEYHKFNKNLPHKRIIEDYEKPKVNGKDVETIPNTNHEFEDSEEIRQIRSLTSSWDPQELLRVLYRLDFHSEPLKKQIRYINKEGYLEKLPSGRKKATYWNPWKTKYIKLKDGFFYCYDYSIDVSILPDLLKHIFCELNIQPENYKIQLSMPRNLSLQTKLKIACMLLDDFRVKGINLTHQAILSLHAYNSKSGIIVDIGDRLDVIPIIEGYIVESGVTRLPYGGQRMIHHLKQALAEKNISVVSDVQTYLARYILEQLCYVAEDYTEELQRYHTNPDDFEMSLSTSHFFNDDCLWDEIVLDLGRFHVPEGLFTPEKWGIDNPGLHKLVHHAIQECGVDQRREMSRSIFVSGGLTLLPGFVERLEAEVDKLTPDTIVPKVHASPYRCHMSYIGACQIALGDKFDDICITKQMWKKEGNTCVKKWHI